MRTRLSMTCLLVASVTAPSFATPAEEPHRCFGKVATIVGTDGPDFLKGTRGPDVIVGLGGTDEIWAFAGNDLVCGGPNPDSDDREYILGGGGDDKLSGGSGSDELQGERGDDILRGGPGGWAGNVLNGRDGNDRIYGGNGDDQIWGGDGNDVMQGRGWTDAIEAGAGRDRLSGGEDGPRGDMLWHYSAPNGVRVDLAAGVASGHGRDVLDGFENIVGSDHGDVLLGNERANRFLGGGGADELVGRGGDDCLVGQEGRNEARGGAGRDAYDLSTRADCARLDYQGPVYPGRHATIDLEAGVVRRKGETTTVSGVEVFFGSIFNDLMIGNDNVNTFYANGGDDELRGSGGDDFLDAGPGTDAVDGGDGEDRCVNWETPTSCETLT